MARTKWDVKEFVISLRVRITAAMDKRLKRRARSRSATVSKVVRKAIETELSKEQNNGKHKDM